MFGWVHRDPFKGVTFPHTVFTGSSVPTPGEIREIVASLALAPVRGLRQRSHTLADAVEALNGWLVSEEAILRNEFVDEGRGKGFTVLLARSDARFGAVKADFFLTTEGLSGGIAYGSFIRRVGVDAFAINIDGVN